MNIVYNVYDIDYNLSYYNENDGTIKGFLSYCLSKSICFGEKYIPCYLNDDRFKFPK